MSVNNITRDELGEFLCLQESSSSSNCLSNPGESFFNNKERTNALLDFYKLHKTKLGTFECKSMKKLWELVARDLSNMYRITISAQKCENKFKVLERTYKKIIDNDSKTGRGRKIFEFQEKMEEIFHKKVNIKPLILLTNDKTLHPSQTFNENTEQSSSQRHEEIEVQVSIPEVQDTINAPDLGSNASLPSSSREKETTRPVRKMRSRATPTYKKRNDILSEIKNDLKSYYDRKLKIEEEKLQLNKDKMGQQNRRTIALEKQVELLSQIKDKLYPK